MDIGRYADILLNIILGILIFYFPGGYTWTLFLGMAASHVWIYLFDYYKAACSLGQPRQEDPYEGDSAVLSDAA